MDKTNRSFWAGPSIDYWIKRALEREQEAYLRGAGLSAKLFEEYQAAAVSIRKEINDFYSRYAGKYGFTHEQAVQLLNRAEMQEWRASLGDYATRLAKVQDPQIKKLLTAELDALSFNSSINRLEALNGQINMILNDLYEKGVAQMKAEFGDNFTQSYYQKLYDIQSRVGYITEIAKVTPRMIENIVSYPWLGAMFSDRLWQNKQALIFSLREITTRGTIQGRSIAAMSQEISGRMGQSYRVAERLIRTETNHFHNSAEIAAYEAAGITEYEYMATLDNRTSEICADLDGKVFKVKDAMPGTNFPPMHPYCRSTTIEHDPEEALDWAASGKEMPKNMTYGEWAEEQELKRTKPITRKDQKLETVSDKVYNNGVSFNNKQFGRKVGKHALDYGLDPNDMLDRERMRGIIQDIVTNRDEIVRGMWPGQGGRLPSGRRASGMVDFIVKGDDIVIAKEGEFISILKDGVNNTRFRAAKRRGEKG